MKIVFFGDSITDMGRNRDCAGQEIFGYGSGYPMFVAGSLYGENPVRHKVVNRGIGGNRIVDLYARIKADVWNLNPDVLSILIGINDVWHEIMGKNGVDPERFEKVYRMLIEDTLKRLPNIKTVLCEPFVLEGSATGTKDSETFLKFREIYKYAAIVKKLAEEYGLYFLPLQKRFDEAAERFGAEHYLYDGVHPMVAGAKLIADEWLKLFREKIEVKQ